jgi:hypothetical protein
MKRKTMMMMMVRRNWRSERVRRPTQERADVTMRRRARIDRKWGIEIRRMDEST